MPRIKQESAGRPRKGHQIAPERRSTMRPASGNRSIASFEDYSGGSCEDRRSVGVSSIESDYQSEGTSEWEGSNPGGDQGTTSTHEYAGVSAFGYPHFSHVSQRNVEASSATATDTSIPLSPHRNSLPHKLVGPRETPALNIGDAIDNKQLQNEFLSPDTEFDCSPTSFIQGSSSSSSSSQSSASSVPASLARLLNSPAHAPFPITPASSNEASWRGSPSLPSGFPAQYQPSGQVPEVYGSHSLTDAKRTKGKGKAKDESPPTITLTSPEASSTAPLPTYSILPRVSRPMRPTKTDANVTVAFRSDPQPEDSNAFRCGWEGCNAWVAGDALGVRRHFETVHWDEGIYVRGTALVINCGWSKCRFHSSGIRWDAYPRHVLTSHFSNGDMHRCFQCNTKEYKRKDALLRHMRDSCLRCERCTTKFDTMELLTEHMIGRSQGRECEKRSKRARVK